jgi:hypothetical protein
MRPVQVVQPHLRYFSQTDDKPEADQMAKQAMDEAKAAAKAQEEV